MGRAGPPGGQVLSCSPCLGRSEGSPPPWLGSAEARPLELRVPRRNKPHLLGPGAWWVEGWHPSPSRVLGIMASKGSVLLVWCGCGRWGLVPSRERQGLPPPPGPASLHLLETALPLPLPSSICRSLTPILQASTQQLRLSFLCAFPWGQAQGPRQVQHRGWESFCAPPWLYVQLLLVG